MNTNDTPNITTADVIALKNEPDALRVITAKLRVKEMGPADHIRTKHEVRDFLASGNVTAVDGIVARAQARRELQQVARQEMTQRQGQHLSQ